MATTVAIDVAAMAVVVIAIAPITRAVIVVVVMMIAAIIVETIAVVAIAVAIFTIVAITIAAIAIVAIAIAVIGVAANIIIAIDIVAIAGVTFAVAVVIIIADITLNAIILVAITIAAITTAVVIILVDITIIAITATDSVIINFHSLPPLLLPFISNNSSFCQKCPGVPDGSDGSEGTSYPLTVNYTLSVPQAMGPSLLDWCSGLRVHLGAPGGTVNHCRAVWEKQLWECCWCAWKSYLLLIIQRFLKLMYSVCILIYVSI